MGWRTWVAGSRARFGGSRGIRGMRTRLQQQCHWRINMPLAGAERQKTWKDTCRPTRAERHMFAGRALQMRGHSARPRAATKLFSTKGARPNLSAACGARLESCPDLFIHGQWKHPEKTKYW
ncbi:hypothetical protein TraAM80_06165 [Trypanosoma rangeli]|uniref:Uncharacterized protein n=1 Tax=Trypanosoma rangeli TaxID=5698 RepID=A0A3R7K720_TRYRA|nr:uncharacterized protein TraAM80_06165 [Trypanosoma rangeli]RNF02813.1 hypothetical protein TraAM80_06165 [Trypanosoma rangeli]|eukprot:RNF02813.1 hypothetical protein TraAM80_06165 [Trypanosoma rangeli]